MYVKYWLYSAGLTSVIMLGLRPSLYALRERGGGDSDMIN